MSAQHSASWQKGLASQTLSLDVGTLLPPVCVCCYECSTLLFVWFAANAGGVNIDLCSACMPGYLQGRISRWVVGSAVYCYVRGLQQ